MQTKKWLLGGAAAGTIATLTALVAAAPNDRPGGSANNAPGNDDDSYPAGCVGPSKVTKVGCPSTLTYAESDSSPSWMTTTYTTSGVASYLGAVASPNGKTLTCQYTADGTDRLTIARVSATACVVAKKHPGFNCCN